jgi:hypothetical protein
MSAFDLLRVCEEIRWDQRDILRFRDRLPDQLIDGELFILAQELEPGLVPTDHEGVHGGADLQILGLVLDVIPQKSFVPAEHCECKLLDEEKPID